MAHSLKGQAKHITRSFSMWWMPARQTALERFLLPARSASRLQSWTQELECRRFNSHASCSMVHADTTQTTTVYGSDIQAVDPGWHPGAGPTSGCVPQHGLSGLHNRPHHLDCQVEIWGCMQTEQRIRVCTGHDMFLE